MAIVGSIRTARAAGIEQAINATMAMAPPTTVYASTRDESRNRLIRTP